MKKVKQRKSIIIWFHLFVEYRNNIRRRRREMKGGKLEGGMNHERLWTPRNKLRVWGRGCG